MFKILSIFLLISLLTKKLDGLATGLADVSLSLGGVALPLPIISATNQNQHGQNQDGQNQNGQKQQGQNQNDQNQNGQNQSGQNQNDQNQNDQNQNGQNQQGQNQNGQNQNGQNQHGRCNPPSSCPNNNPPSCGRNEIWNQCGGCEATCNNPNPSCSFICGPGACRCRDGWVRHPNGNCVDPQQCFSNPCQPNEVFNRCSTGCEGTCSNTRPFCMFDSQSCRFSRCECPISSGFVRDNFGNCIPSSQCPSQDSPSCSGVLCPQGNVCVMQKPSNCNFCSELPTCIQMPSCQNIHCSNGFHCTIPSCQNFPCDPICVRSN